MAQHAEDGGKVSAADRLQKRLEISPGAGQQRIKDKLPSGSSQRIADEVGVSVDEVRNYFGGRHFDSEGGSPVGIHMEKGPDGGVVTLDDSAILDCALRIIAETEAAKQQV